MLFVTLYFWEVVVFDLFYAIIYLYKGITI